MKTTSNLTGRIVKSGITIFFLLLIFGGQSDLYAQNPLQDKYRRMAIDYDQMVRSAALEVDRAESTKEAAKTDYYPRIDFEGNYDYIGRELEIPQYSDIKGFNHFYNLNLYLSQPIYTGGYIKYNYKAAELGQRIAEDQSALSQQDIIMQTDEIYWTVVAQNEKVELSFQFRQTIIDLVRVIQDRVDAEVLSREDLLMAQAQLNSAELFVLQMGNMLVINKMNLNRITGQPIDMDTEIDTVLNVSFKDYNNDDLINRAHNQRPEIRVQESIVELNETYTKLTLSKYLPQFGVGVSGLLGSPSYDRQVSPDFNYGAFARLNIPLVHWGKKKKEIFANDIQTEVAALSLERAKDFVSLQVNESSYWLSEAVVRVNLTGSSLANADENLVVVTDRYDEGLTSILAILDAQVTWQRAYMDFIEAKLNYLVSYSGFQRALGELSIGN